MENRGQPFMISWGFQSTYLEGAVQYLQMHNIFSTMTPLLPTHTMSNNNQLFINRHNAKLQRELHCKHQHLHKNPGLSLAIEIIYPKYMLKPQRNNSLLVS